MAQKGQRAKLGDFGLAKETVGSSIQASSQKGTWEYMAPEMVKSKIFVLDLTSNLL